MAGFSIVMLMLPFFAVTAAMAILLLLICAGIVLYLIYSYVFEGIFTGAVRRNAGRCPAVGWIPLYRQYLLGVTAGKNRLGIALMLDYLAVAVLLLLPIAAEQYLLYWLLAVLALLLLGFVLKSVISHGIYRMAMPKYSDLFTVLSVLTLGLLRSAFLFALRNRVPVGGE